MSKNDLEEQLRTAIAAAIEALPKSSPTELTRWTRKHYPSLIEEFQERWADDRLRSIFRSELHHQRPMKHGRPGLSHPQQDRFPFPGFEKIPVWISLEAGSREKQAREKYLDQATLEDLNTRRALVRATLSAELPQLNKLIAIMERYDRAEPGIKVGEALARQAATTRRASNRRA